MELEADERTGVFAYPGKLSESICNRILELASSQWVESEVQDSVGIESPDKGLRRSDIFWTTEQWLVDLIWSYMEAYNEGFGFHYDIDALEDIQLTRYGIGGFYDFHIDGMGTHRNAHNAPGSKLTDGKVRKLSMSIQLNEDYSGGDFEVAFCRDGRCAKKKMDKKQGTIIMFPSVLEHRVKPVKRGMRYSLVAWFLGPPFR